MQVPVVLDKHVPEVHHHPKPYKVPEFTHIEQDHHHHSGPSEEEYGHHYSGGSSDEHGGLSGGYEHYGSH